MRKVSESGTSFLQVLGILFLITGIGVGAFLGAEQFYHRQHMDETTKFMSNVLSRFSDVKTRAIREQYTLQNANFFKGYGLVSECDVTESAFDSSKKVCHLPLGEFMADVSFSYPYLYSYFYVIFDNRIKRQSCQEFLSKGWEKIIPHEWWGKLGYLGTISDTGEGKMFYSLNPEFVEKEGASTQPDAKLIKNVCRVCKKSQYCGVVFFFMNDQ